jgi:hypothetical protein
VSVVLAFGAAIVRALPRIFDYIDHLRGITEELDRQKALGIEISNIYLGEADLSATVTTFYGTVEPKLVGDEADLAF